MIEEIFKPIPGFPDYEVSNMGVVRSLKRGKVRIVSFFLLSAKKPYLTVNLYSNGKEHVRLVHRLVMLAFVGPCPEGMQVCHYDCNRANNCLTNLRYDTPFGNAQDSIRMGNRYGGNGIRLLTLEQAEQARYGGLSGIPIRTLGQKYGIDRSAMGRLLRGKSYANAGGPIKGKDY